MFEFGRDLRKLFAQARESEDLGWVELIGVDLLHAEARGQSVDAGRVSCARPFDAWLRASALWREHARRTGSLDSLDRAASAAEDALKAAADAPATARASLAIAETLLMRFDLFGGDQRLDAASTLIERGGDSRAAQGAHARLAARRARLSGDAARLLDAAALLDAALHDEKRAPDQEQLRMERAMLGLEAGLARRDARLLDQAGRDLRALVESASPDQRPLTRARALALCGAGMKALAALADDDDARAQGDGLFTAASDQFTPDHSPLDWVAVQVLGAGPETPLKILALAQAQSGEPGLILGALAREARFAGEVARAAEQGDPERLDILEAALRRRLAADHRIAPVDWAADLIALARLAQARELLTGVAKPAMGMALVEAAEAAREEGAWALAARAEALRQTL